MISYIADYWAIKTVDKPIGFYIIYRDKSGHELTPEALPAVEVVPFNRIEQKTRSWMDEYPQPDAQNTYFENEGITNIESDSLCPILPTPYYYKKENTGYYAINKHTRLAYQSSLVAEAGLL